MGKTVLFEVMCYGQTSLKTQLAVGDTLVTPTDKLIDLRSM